MWLAPRQVVIASIISDVDSYVDEVAELLKAQGVRVETDKRNKKISYKVREHSSAKVPVIMVIGKKEAEERSLSVRRLGSDKNISYDLKTIVDEISNESKSPVNS